MGVYLVKTYIYQFIVGIVCILFAWHTVKQRELYRKLMSAIVLIPFLLRFFLVK